MQRRPPCSPNGNTNVDLAVYMCVCWTKPGALQRSTRPAGEWVGGRPLDWGPNRSRHSYWVARGLAAECRQAARVWRGFSEHSCIVVGDRVAGGGYAPPNK